ncbi:hypothetical protein ACP70R_031343 [Stipagrostis hirtigluma subsp. patula]
MPSPPGSPPAPAPAPPLGLVRIARRVLREEDLFSGTCRRDHYCIACQHAFCSHCCGFHHIHLDWGPDVVVKVDLDAGGRPVFPTHTPAGHRIPRFIADEMAAAADYTSRLARDAFCLHCARAFRADACSHHDHRREGLPDAVVRVEERGGRLCVRCTGAEWWAPHLDVALGDPVHAGEDEQGRCYELLPVLRYEPGTCQGCAAALPWRPCTYCSEHCAEAHLRDIVERGRRREARNAARGTTGIV